MMKVVQADGSHDPRAFPAAPAGNDFHQPKYHSCSRYHGGSDHYRTAHSHCHILNATFPYMMAGLAGSVLLVFLSMALLVCCSRRIVQASIQQRSAQSQQEGRAAAPQNTAEPSGTVQMQNLTPQLAEKLDQQDVRSTKVVVIMAGDEMPSFLALPVATLMDQIKPDASNKLVSELPAA